MMEEINSCRQLEALFENHPCQPRTPNKSYHHARYVSMEVFDSLVKYVLAFEPYITAAKNCGMREICIMRSQQTNRFYIGFVNIGGHSPRYEIMPVNLARVMDHAHLESMLANYGQKLDARINLNENYEI